MTYSELASGFCFEMPDYAKELYPSFEAEYDPVSNALDENDAMLVAESASLPEDGKAALLECVRKINSSRDSSLKAKFLIHITVKKRHPWQNRIYTDRLFDVPGLMPEQVGWVIVAAALANTVKNKKPPEGLNRENLNAFHGYSRSCFEQKGYWGILEWSWNMLCAGGCMFVFGVLKFVPGEFGNDFRVITDGKCYVSLANGEYFVDPAGALTEDQSEAVCRTSVEEDAETISAHVISARGTVETKRTSFPKSVWKDFLRNGSPTLDIHIPPKVEYTPERIKESCEEALAFYRRFYADFEPKAIAGYSWIFSPQLKKVLPENGNILSVNRSLHILPCIGTYDSGCRFLRPGSSLQKRIKDECANGVRFHYAVMYAPVGEIETFGKETE